VFPELLESIARKLDESGIPYMVIGGQAVVFHGEPRLTRDIDITLGVNSDEVGRTVTLAKGLGLEVLTKDPEAFAQKTMVLPAQDKKSGLRVDFIFSFSSYEREAIARAVAVPLKSTTVRFGAVEDIIIHKLVAGRPRDIDDVRAILARRAKYDETYVRRWLTEFDRALARNCTEVFDTLLRQTREPPRK
jgi:predicted nucleotidyltransferase